MLKVGVPGFTQVPQLLVYNLKKISERAFALSDIFSLSKNSVLHQAGTAHFKQLLKKRAKKQKKSELFQLHVANFFRFMHANLSVTQFVTRAKPL